MCINQLLQVTSGPIWILPHRVAYCTTVSDTAYIADLRYKRAETLYYIYCTVLIALAMSKN